MSTTVRILLLTIVAAVAITVALVRRGGQSHDVSSSAATPADGTFTIAATGDTVLTAAWPPADNDAAFAALMNVIGHATLAATNLEQVLLDEPSPALQARVDWPTGSPREARVLARHGFDLIARANNHAGDLGAEGIRQTSGILDAAGLLHAGAGPDLDDARSARFLSRGGRHVAFIAVSTSVAAEARATRTRGDIVGRAGVNALRFHADITVDPATFATLSASAPALQPEAEVNPGELRLFGRSIRKGERTQIEFRLHDEDVREVLDVVTRAAKAADVVVLSLHSHEPSNGSDAPADFVRQFARAAIDAGADLVIGHGPHRLRGLEVHEQGLIMHSLGNFLFPQESLASRAADVFDAGVDLYALALGAVEPAGSRPIGPIETPEWWESVVAVTTFENGALRSVRLHPIDLGTDLPLARRGTPRLAVAGRAAAILERVAALSAALGTEVKIDGGVGYLEMSGGAGRAHPPPP
jgi:poly-gamma-glutamate capsule biosynthesis protein CapA/YwtB (metallophosphatase superfamily)